MMLTNLTVGRWRVIAVMRGLEQERTTLRVNSSAAETCTTVC